LPHLNPDWFYLYGTGLPGCLGKEAVFKLVVVVAAAAAAASPGHQHCATCIGTLSFPVRYETKKTKPVCLEELAGHSQLSRGVSMLLQGDGSTQQITELTADEWDSLQSLLCDDVSIKSELFPSVPVGTEVDCSGVVVPPVSANIINVPPITAPMVTSPATNTVAMVNGSASTLSVVLNPQVKIRPKPLSHLAANTSLPTSQTGVLGYVCSSPTFHMKLYNNSWLRFVSAWCIHCVVFLL